MSFDDERTMYSVRQQVASRGINFSAVVRIRRVLKPLGRGSDYYGPCEVCGKKMSEAFKHYTQTGIRRLSGAGVFDLTSPGAYGHESCLADMYGPAGATTPD